MDVALFSHIAFFIFYIIYGKQFKVHSELCDSPSMKSILSEQHQAVTVFEHDFSLCSQLQWLVAVFHK